MAGPPSPGDSSPSPEKTHGPTEFPVASAPSLTSGRTRARLVTHEESGKLAIRAPLSPGGPEEILILAMPGALGSNRKFKKAKKPPPSKTGLQRACGDSRPKPPKRSRTFQGAIAPGAFNPWSRTLGALGDALWNVLDHFKAHGLLQPPSLQRRALDFPFFRGRSLLKPSGYSRV